MKFRITKKEVIENYGNVRCIGYCAAQTLLKNHKPIAYNCGVYGWNFDMYDVYGVAICTGYRNLPNAQILVNYEEYEKTAKKIERDYSLSYEEQNAKIETLLKELCSINKQ